MGEDAFTFDNAARLMTSTNPDFFKGTAGGPR
jgi:hypothetical protein